MCVCTFLRLYAIMRIVCLYSHPLCIILIAIFYMLNVVDMCNVYTGVVYVVCSCVWYIMVSIVCAVLFSYVYGEIFVFVEEGPASI